MKYQCLVNKIPINFLKGNLQMIFQKFNKIIIDVPPWHVEDHICEVGWHGEVCLSHTTLGGDQTVLPKKHNFTKMMTTCK